MGVVSDCSWKKIYISSFHWCHGCCLLVRIEGGCFWEVYNVIVLCRNQSGTFGLVAPELLVAFGGVVKRGFTV